MSPKIGSSPAPAPGVFPPNPPPPPAPKAPPPPAKKAAVVDEFVPAKLPQKSIAMTAGPSGVNKTDSVRPSASGAISKKEWDNPQLLVAKLTQNPASGATNNSGERCGPSNLLGGELMKSPEHAAKFLTNVANAPENNRLTSAEKTELKSLADKVKNKTATFEELGRAQDLLYKSGNRVTDVDQAVADALKEPAVLKLNSFERQELSRLKDKPTWTAEDRTRIGELVTKASGSPSRVVADPAKAGTFLMTVEGARTNTDTSAFSDKEVSDLAKMGGLTQQSVPMGDTQTVKSLFQSLKPGESAVIRVSGSADGNTPDHFVTVGRREDGTAFIYNPDPAKGDSTLFVGTKGAKQGADFMKELKRYEDRVGFDPNGKLPNYTKVG